MKLKIFLTIFLLVGLSGCGNEINNLGFPEQEEESLAILSETDINQWERIRTLESQNKMLLDYLGVVEWTENVVETYSATMYYPRGHTKTRYFSKEELAGFVFDDKEMLGLDIIKLEEEKTYLTDDKFKKEWVELDCDFCRDNPKVCYWREESQCYNLKDKLGL